MSDPNAKLTLAHKKNLRDNEANKTAHLAKLKGITGFDYTVEFNPSWEEVIPILAKDGMYTRDHEKIGDILFGKDGYLDFVVRKFEDSCKDEMIKEALLDATSSRKLIFTFKPRRSKDNVITKLQFKDNAMQFQLEANQFGTGHAKYICEADITKML